MRKASDRQERINRLERDREAVLIYDLKPSRSTMGTLAPEDRNALYRRHGVKAKSLPDGGVEIGGMLVVDEEGSTTITTSSPET